MKPLAKLGYQAAACALLVATFLIIGPPTVRAAVAALVQVANTRSTPVPNQDVDHPARHPYQQTCQGSSSSGPVDCFMPIVPADTEVVIQTVSMLLVGGTTTPQFGLFSAVAGGQSASVYLPLFVQSGPASVSTQALTRYADPGSSPTCGINGLSTQGTLYCTIIGYSVSLP
jgi:hypothetical protein